MFQSFFLRGKRLDTKDDNGGRAKKTECRKSFTTSMVQKRCGLYEEDEAASIMPRLFSRGPGCLKGFTISRFEKPHSISYKQIIFYNQGVSTNKVS